MSVAKASRSLFLVTLALLLLALALAPLQAQRELHGYPQLKLALQRLQVLGSVLMIGAHPDDENTALLAYLARGRHLRAAYLSLTRGEGGQNLIGAEQGELLGLVRTQELLAARRIDGAEQFFTRAVDFGYSKSLEETLQKWGREEVLGDIVWVIRKFRPDVVVLRFSGTARDGHGHHQASAVLGKEAAQLAGDPSQYPDQLQWVEPWQPKRVVWNTFSFGAQGFRDTAEVAGRLDLEIGHYNPVLGLSYGEIAGMSRSMHRSQGFGAPLRRGSLVNSFVVVAGEPASRDLLDGVDTSWRRVPGGAPVAELLAKAEQQLNPDQPEQIIPLLLEARTRISQLDTWWAREKLPELDEAIALAAGLRLDATVDTGTLIPGKTARLSLQALNRSTYSIRWAAASLSTGETIHIGKSLAYNQPVRQDLDWNVPARWSYTRPYWLRAPKEGERYGASDPEVRGLAEDPPLLSAVFRLEIDGVVVELRRPVVYRYVDRVEGELEESPAVLPPISLVVPAAPLVFPRAAARDVAVRVVAHTGGVGGTVELELPPAWRASPNQRSFRLDRAGEAATMLFRVDPPAEQQTGWLKGVARLGDTTVGTGVRVISYPHIPKQVVTYPAETRIVRVEAKTLARSVGYVMGAGDEVPEALRQLGCDVTLLGEQELAEANLARFDAIVTGVRAFNVRQDLRAHFQRLLDYVRDGGTLVVQYNVASGGPAGEPSTGPLGPYPLVIGRGRVTVEEAPVRFLEPAHPLLAQPNPITQADFEGWIQERGLYFASEWDSHYTPLFAMADPGEAPLAGSTLVARLGKGVYIFTALSWFRQLPAGVPGAYRIFANFLSASRVMSQ